MLSSDLSPVIPYEVTFVTSDVQNAGTTCNVLLVLFGSRGASKEYRVDKVEDRFERGHQDLVKVRPLLLPTRSRTAKYAQVPYRTGLQLSFRRLVLVILVLVSPNPTT